MVNPDALSRIYRQVLDDSIRFAEARHGADADHEDEIRQRFLNQIPQELPEEFAPLADDRELPKRLRQHAARQLMAICLDVPEPRGDFVAAIAQKAEALIAGR